MIKKETQNKNKEMIYLKFKENNSNTKIFKKEIEYSELYEYDKIETIIINSIKNILIKKGSKEEENNIKVIIKINHPKIKEIYIYKKEEWNLYFNYNLINDCIEKKTLKFDYIKIINNNYYNLDNIITEYKNNQINIFKYIIKNSSLSFYLNTLFNFFQNEKEKETSKRFRFYFISELINNPPKKYIDINQVNNNDEEDNIEENVNINNIIYNQINKKEENNNKNDIKKNKLINHYIKYIKDEFFNIVKEQFDYFSKFQNYEKIKNIFDEDNQINIDNNLKELDKNNNINKTIINLNNNLTFGKISNFEEDSFDNSIENNNNILFTQLNLSKKFVKNLINNGQLFKKLNQKEYYNDIESLKDELRRHSLEIEDKTIYK